MSNEADEHLTADYVRERLRRQGIDIDSEEASGVLEAAGWIAAARWTARRLVAGERPSSQRREAEAYE